MSIQELENEILKLNLKDRATLLEKLIASLDELDSTENLQIWAEEAERRSEQVENGMTKTISAKDVYARIKAISNNEN